MTVLGAPVATAFARGPFLAGGVVILEEEEAHHLRVRRVEEGASIRLVDGKGGVATARLTIERQVLEARVAATITVAAPPRTELLVGAGDRDRFLMLVEKATELGATRIVPLVTERSVAVASRFQAAHLEKASRRAREALKQSGGAWAPVIAAPAALAEVLRGATKTGLRCLAHAEGGPMVPVREGDAVQFLVGPEGGLSEAEFGAARAAGYVPVALGRATLRFDTAAVACLAVTAAARLRAGNDPRGGTA
jgi:16S rRNA (uracil1498-N3)-methyltransferase